MGIAWMVVIASLLIVYFTLIRKGSSPSFKDGPFRQAGREVKRQRQEFDEAEKSENEKSGEQ